MGNALKEEADHTLPATSNPDVSIEKLASVTESTLGDTVDYTIVVKNTGNITLKEVNVVDTLQADFAEATIVKSLNQDDLLDVGESWTYTYSHVVNQNDVDRGGIENTAKVQTKPLKGTEVIEKSSNSNVNVPRNPSFAVNKTAAVEDPSVGQTITYTVTVKNRRCDTRYCFCGGFPAGR